jgi:small subunit ribosomal protein S16
MEVNSERVAYWLGVGAQPTDPVLAILKRTGDWQAFKGEPAPPPLLMAKPKVSRTEAYQAAVALAHADVDDTKTVGKAGSGTAPRRAKATKDSKDAKAPAADEAPATEAPAEAAPDAAAAEPTTEAATDSAPTADDTEAKA